MIHSKGAASDSILPNNFCIRSVVLYPVGALCIFLIASFNWQK